MKRLFTIVMLSLFLLNVLGFYGIFLGLQFRNAQETNSNLDKELYSSYDAVTFKIPLSIPYSSNHQDFERVSGEFEHQGEVYRLLKQKYIADTLVVVCVKDRDAGKINQALTDYVKTFTDKPLNAKHQNSKSIQSFCKDYVSTSVSLASQSSGWRETVIYPNLNQNIFSFNPSRIEYPPRQV